MSLSGVIGGVTARALMLAALCSALIVPSEVSAQLRTTPPSLQSPPSSPDVPRPPAEIPGGTTLLGGNYARTFFTPQGGDFATQSRGDILNNSWVVSATGFGSFGGPVTDTAFCAPEADHGRRSELWQRRRLRRDVVVVVGLDHGLGVRFGVGPRVSVGRGCVRPGGLVGRPVHNNQSIIRN